MSLRVWLPLNGDLHNQGLDEIAMTNSGAVVDNSGKIGKCYSFDGSNDYLSSSYNFYNPTYSICTWIYTTSTATQCICCDRTSVGSGFAVFLYNKKLRIDSGGYGLLWETSYTFPTSTWFHLAIVYDGTATSYFINGELQDKKNQAISSAYWGNTTSIGASQANGSSYDNYLKGKLNDFRIYDHALSAKEIKEISKALVLHYPLDGVGTNENLIRELASGGRTSIVNKYNEISLDFSQNLDTYFSFYPNKDLIAGEHYTISCECEGFPSDDNWAQFGVISQGSGKNFRVKNGYNSFTFTVDTTITAGTKTILDDNSRYASGLTIVRMFNVKLEKGSKATPWIPAPSDPLYTKMGFDSTIVYDESGFGNDGTANNITIDSDSPRYDQCAVFTRTNSSWIKVNENNWMAQGAPEYTINLWVNTSAWPSRLFSCTESGGFNCEGGTSGYVRNALRAYTNEAKTSSAYIYQNTELKYSDLSAGWHMITFTYDSTSKKSYIDGELHNTYNVTSYGVHFNLNTRLYLGCEASGANPSTPYFEGKESDFRFYYTALSAEDIKELYEVGMSIDNKQNIHTYEIDEAGAIGISKTGILTSKTEFVEEDDDPNVHLYKSGEVTANHFYEE